MRRCSGNMRLLVLSVVLTVCFAAVLGKVFYLQVVKAADYTEWAAQQQDTVVSIPAKRGPIVDREGAALALTCEAVSVCADPSKVENPSAVAEFLAPMLGMETDDLVAKLAGKGTFAYLARQVDPLLGQKVLSLGYAGIFLLDEDKRVYPEGALASQILGYVGTDLDTGLEGIERQYNAQLAGKAGSRRVVSDGSSRVLEVISEQPAEPGQEVALTIDRDIQYQAEQVLAETVEEFQAKSATAVVLDSRTGDVLAMARTPVYDANDFLSSSLSDRRNTAVVDLFEPGSTFKLVVAAAALAEDLVTPQTQLTLEPSITVQGATIREADEDVPSTRTLTVTEVIARSSNVGAVTLGLKVGKDKLYQMIRTFGFLEPTGIDFPGEAAGLVLPPSEWNPATMVNVPIGQGISVTALQLACAYAAVANDGVWVQPRLAMSAPTQRTHRVVSTSVAQDLRSMLQETVENGTGALAAIPGYSVAGKTGTAQKAREDGLGYADDKYVASFVGMVPAGAPRLVILVAVDEPTDVHMGSEVAAPAFARIAAFALQHLGIAPDQAPEG